MITPLDDDVTFNLEIVELIRLPLKLGLIDVVWKVVVRYSATYEGVTKTIEEEFELPDPDPNSFIEYSNLTLADVKLILGTQEIVDAGEKNLLRLQNEVKCVKGTPWE